MRDSFSPSPEQYFSERDFSELRESRDAVLIRVADVLKREIPLALDVGGMRGNKKEAFS